MISSALQIMNGHLPSCCPLLLAAAHQYSLSMLSPNPGVSTMVRPMRMPSSSSSTLTGLILIPPSMWAVSGLSEILGPMTSDSVKVRRNVDLPVPDAPTAMRQKETPFFVARRRDVMIEVVGGVRRSVGGEPKCWIDDVMFMNLDGASSVRIVRLPPARPPSQSASTTHGARATGEPLGREQPGQSTNQHFDQRQSEAGLFTSMTSQKATAAM